MEKGFKENGFVIDLSNTTNTSQVVTELNSVMEHPEVKGKHICLKIGGIDLKQSQLLSIKALIESMDADIMYVNTTSEQTEASAQSLGIQTSEPERVEDVESYVSKEVEEEMPTETEYSTSVTENIDEEEIGKTVLVEADLSGFENIISTKEGVADVYTEESTHIISEVIPSEHFKNDFELLAYDEGLVKPEEISKYILLETGDVLPEGVEENSVDTKTLPTLYLNQNLRSGQTVNYEGNILILGDAHPGSEIIADGDITVWGILGGIAHAGAKGNITSKVRALKLNAIQLRIAGLYARRNDTLNVPYVQKSNEFTPEEAQIENGKIVIYKKLRRD